MNNSGNNVIKTRVILANGIPLFRQALKGYILQEQDMEVIAETGDGQEAVKLASRLHPDLIIMDLVMSNLDGLEATRQIVRKCPGTKVLVLTITENNDLKRDILQSGASGFLSINTSCSGITYAIRKIAKSEKVFELPLLEDTPAGNSIPTNMATRLSVRELSILKLVAKGVSNKEIAQTLDLSLHYVKTCLTNIFAKLSVSSRTEAVSIALKSGIIEIGDLQS